MRYNTTNRRKKVFRSDYSAKPSHPCDNAVCIPLTRGNHILIDADDFHIVSDLMWYTQSCPRGSRYAFAAICSGGNKKSIAMHRIIARCPENMFTDHVNGNSLDNRKSNLRICTNQQNGCNSKTRKNSSSQYKGVSWSANNKKWQASIRANKKLISLGYFKEEVDAATAYNFAAIAHHGEFARLNIASGAVTVREDV